MASMGVDLSLSGEPAKEAPKAAAAAKPAEAPKPTPKPVEIPKPVEKPVAVAPKPQVSPPTVISAKEETIKQDIAKSPVAEATSEEEEAIMGQLTKDDIQGLKEMVGAFKALKGLTSVMAGLDTCFQEKQRPQLLRQRKPPLLLRLKRRQRLFSRPQQRKKK